MKGLLAIPKTSDLQIAYAELESHTNRPSDRAREISVERVALLSQWARLDPRLAEILTGYLCTNWAGLNVLKLLQELSAQPWPRAILVPLRFVEAVFVDSTEIPRAVLRGLINTIEEAFPEKSNDLFFIPLQRMNRVLLDQALDFQSLPYRRSGYIGAASLLAKGRMPAEATIIGRQERGRVLEDLIRTMHRGEILAVEDYIERCQGRVSRRQAQRDLEASPKLKAVGFTRAKRYLLHF